MKFNIHNHNFINETQKSIVQSSLFSIPDHDFNLRFIYQPGKEYDALKDPHANYYFVSNAAKERLKDLKK